MYQTLLMERWQTKHSFCRTESGLQNPMERYILPSVWLTIYLSIQGAGDKQWVAKKKKMDCFNYSKLGFSSTVAFQKAHG